MIYIFDIDGTLSDLEHRLHFIKEKPANWGEFFRACPEDKPIHEIIEVARALFLAGHTLVAITGRSDEIRDETDKWLYDNQCWMPCLMRKQGDHREDNIVKSELLDQLLATTPRGDIAGVFEDRQQVVDMYRARGFRVFQVAEGKF